MLLHVAVTAFTCCCCLLACTSRSGAFVTSRSSLNLIGNASSHRQKDVLVADAKLTADEPTISGSADLVVGTEDSTETTEAATVISTVEVTTVDSSTIVRTDTEGLTDVETTEAATMTVITDEPTDSTILSTEIESSTDVGTTEATTIITTDEVTTTDSTVGRTDTESSTDVETTEATTFITDEVTATDDSTVGITTETTTASQSRETINPTKELTVTQSHALVTSSLVTSSDAIMTTQQRSTCISTEEFQAMCDTTFNLACKIAVASGASIIAILLTIIGILAAANRRSHRRLRNRPASSYCAFGISNESYRPTDSSGHRIGTEIRMTDTAMYEWNE